jgi:hypothetical protein
MDIDLGRAIRPCVLCHVTDWMQSIGIGMLSFDHLYNTGQQFVSWSNNFLFLNRFLNMVPNTSI